jgi:hypothetical protein
MTHRITALHVKNFKRLHDVEIHPDADRTFILIGGKNGNGKSSVLDALTAAFGGKKQLPDDPVRHGADEATIHVELDHGELEIRRVIDPDGESHLEVRDRLGPVRAPQDMLNSLIGARFLDPLAFLQLPPKEQRAALMRVIPGAERIAGLDVKRDRAFARRTEVGRDLTKAEGELARLPEVTVGTPIDVAALTTEMRELTAQQSSGQDLQRELGQCERETAQATKTVLETNAEQHRIGLEIHRLNARLVDLMATAKAQEVAKEACWIDEEAVRAKVALAAAARKAAQPHRDQLDADLTRADAHNRAVFAAEAQQQRRADVAAETERLAKERGELTQLLDTIDARKAEILAAAALPVDGLAIADHGITLGGVPFAQAGEANRWRVALALAVLGSPDLNDVWIRSGQALDDDALAMVEAYAEDSGRRVWIERVETRDPGVIEIRDGRVRERPVPASAVKDDAP